MADIQHVGNSSDKTQVSDNTKKPESNLIDKIAQDDIKPTNGATDTLKDVNNKLLDKGVLPALDAKDLPDTIANAAEALNNQKISIPADRGLSSASAVSTILKAAGADVKQTMNIADLHQQLLDKGWQEQPYNQGDPLKGGDLLVTSMNPQGRNIGIVGPDGKNVFSHNMRQDMFTGREKWNSKFISVMRAPEAGDK